MLRTLFSISYSFRDIRFERKLPTFFKRVFYSLKVRIDTYKKIYIPYFGLEYNIKLLKAHQNRGGGDTFDGFLEIVVI